MRFLLGDRFGKIIGEADPLIGSVSWLLNQIGTCDFTLRRSSPYFSDEYLEIGNRVYLDFENGLPPWSGVIDLPRGWHRGGTDIQAFTIEHLFKYRITDKNTVIIETNVGNIFRFMVDRANQKEPLGITFGNIWSGGKAHTPEYHYETIWNVLTQSVLKMERCDFRFIPYLEDGYIKHRAELYQIAGSSRLDSVRIVEGSNVGERLLIEEQGELINKFVAAGDGTDWSDDRSVQEGVVLASQEKYGLREGSGVFPGVAARSTLEMYVRNALELHSTPRLLFTLPVTNNEPGPYSSYDLGDEIFCELPTYGYEGFNGSVRVMGREYQPQRDTCDLTVEERRDPVYWLYEGD